MIIALNILSIQCNVTERIGHTRNLDQLIETATLRAPALFTHSRINSCLLSILIREITHQNNRFHDYTNLKLPIMHHTKNIRGTLRHHEKRVKLLWFYETLHGHDEKSFLSCFKPQCIYEILCCSVYQHACSGNKAYNGPWARMLILTQIKLHCPEGVESQS